MGTQLSRNNYHHSSRGLSAARSQDNLRRTQGPVIYQPPYQAPRQGPRPRANSTSAISPAYRSGPYRATRPAYPQEIPSRQNRTRAPALRPSEDQITHAVAHRLLTSLAAMLSSHGHDITIFVSGGIINVLLLGSRQFTYDIDGIVEDRRDWSIIDPMIDAVAQQFGVSGLWLTSRLESFPPMGSQRATLFADSIAQNEVVFRAPGLRLLALPYLWSIPMKLIRLQSSATGKPYDLMDAAAYLLRLLQREGWESLNRATLDGYRSRYALPSLSRRVVMDLNAAYSQIVNYGGPPGTI
ncbi:hypothetical protein FRB96_008949 [Tulasnella sp. 330]|nr:hypothetical protein FRB96_008949 [Tulasnella sp. 330]